MEEQLINQRYKRRALIGGGLLLFLCILWWSSVFYQIFTLQQGNQRLAQQQFASRQLHEQLNVLAQVSPVSSTYASSSDSAPSRSLRGERAYEVFYNAAAQVSVSITAYQAYDLIQEERSALVHLNGAIEQMLLHRASEQLSQRLTIREVLSLAQSYQQQSEAFFVKQSELRQLALESALRQISTSLWLVVILVPLFLLLALRQVALCDRLVTLFLKHRASQQKLDEVKKARGSIAAEKAEYQKLATTCPLTQIYNRKGIFDITEPVFDRVRSGREHVVVLFVDVDDFKQVNDTYGHEVGDKVLVEVARRMAACLREGDFIGRLGGDEFVIVTVGIVAQTVADILAARLTQALNEPFEVAGTALRLSCSVGGALGPQHGDNLNALLRKADQQMYHVKKQGKGAVRI